MRTSADRHADHPTAPLADGDRYCEACFATYTPPFPETVQEMAGIIADTHPVLNEFDDIRVERGRVIEIARCLICNTALPVTACCRRQYCDACRAKRNVLLRSKPLVARRRYRKTAPAVMAKIKREYAKGSDLAGLARKHGVAYRTLYRALKGEPHAEATAIQSKRRSRSVSQRSVRHGAVHLSAVSL